MQYHINNIDKFWEMLMQKLKFFYPTATAKLKFLNFDEPIEMAIMHWPHMHLSPRLEMFKYISKHHDLNKQEKTSLLRLMCAIRAYVWMYRVIAERWSIRDSIVKYIWL